MQYFIKKISLFALIALPLLGQAQILAPYSDYADTANYRLSDGQDSLYFFSIKNDSTFIIVDTANYSGYTIEWEEYQHQTGFVPIAGGEKLLFTPDSVAKGYKLRLTKGASVDSMRCWVVSSDFKLEITSKDSGDTLWTASYVNCDALESIYVLLKKGTFKYFNPENYDTLYYDMQYLNEWTKEKEVEEGDIKRVGKRREIYTYRIVEPYWEDMWYFLEASDSAGTKNKDSVFVRSVFPKADFDKKEILVGDEDYYPNRTEQYYNTYYPTDSYNKNSAPALVEFVSSSKNAQELFWDFGDSTLTENTVDDTIRHIYYFTGDFTPILVAKHTFNSINLECFDTLQGEKITIEPPTLNAPEAFAPKSGQTPYWRFYDVSITDFEIVIFNRHGVKVHSFEGNIRDWNGWDGKYNNSNNYVRTGVYFYIVKRINILPNIDPKKTEPAKWEAQAGENSNNQFRGFVHVFVVN